mmetsp:Transcript_37475/g.97267  ORF Transcript_37475/g.97267 Transcript_37475/m.97267 type:complete len:496 (+) Transcript_37475:179-1666(+)
MADSSLLALGAREVGPHARVREALHARVAVHKVPRHKRPLAHLADLRESTAAPRRPRLGRSSAAGRLPRGGHASACAHPGPARPLDGLPEGPLLIRHGRRLAGHLQRPGLARPRARLPQPRLPLLGRAVLLDDLAPNLRLRRRLGVPLQRAVNPAFAAFVRHHAARGARGAHLALAHGQVAVVARFLQPAVGHPAAAHLGLVRQQLLLDDIAPEVQRVAERRLAVADGQLVAVVPNERLRQQAGVVQEHTRHLRAALPQHPPRVALPELVGNLQECMPATVDAGVQAAENVCAFVQQAKHEWKVVATEAAVGLGVQIQVERGVKEDGGLVHVRHDAKLAGAGARVDGARLRGHDAPQVRHLHVVEELEACEGVAVVRDRQALDLLALDRRLAGWVPLLPQLAPGVQHDVHRRARGSQVAARHLRRAPQGSDVRVNLVNDPARGAVKVAGRAEAPRLHAAAVPLVHQVLDQGRLGEPVCRAHKARRTRLGRGAVQR